MTLNNQEHIDIIMQFEKDFKGRFDKEPKELWIRGNIYQCGQINQLFIAYRKGFALAKCIYQA
jgi:hypothetical protein